MQAGPLCVSRGHLQCGTVINRNSACCVLLLRGIWVYELSGIVMCMLIR
jgi:hypothetical protein